MLALMLLKLSLSFNAAFAQGLTYNPNSPTDQDCGETAIQTAKLVPYMKNRQMKGWTISDIQPQSHWQTRGFLNGDVVLKLDGNNIDNPASGLLLAKAVCTNVGKIKILRSQRKVLIGPKRNQQ